MAPELKGYIFTAAWFAILLGIREFHKRASIQTQESLKIPIIVAGGAVFLAGGYWIEIGGIGLLAMIPAVVLIGIIWTRGSRICKKCGKWTTPKLPYVLNRARFCRECGEALSW